MKKSLVLGIMGLFLASNASAGVTCEEVLKALKLSKTESDLGLAGALNVEDTNTKEIVRIRISQTGHFKKQGREPYYFDTSSVMPISGSGQLFEDLDRKTNMSLVDIKGITDGCIVGFSGRQLGPMEVLIQKEVSNLQVGVVGLRATDDGALSGPLKITYHGKLMD